MPETDDLSRSIVAFEEDSTLVAVIDMIRSSWVVLGGVPGLRSPAGSGLRSRGKLMPSLGDAIAICADPGGYRPADRQVQLSRGKKKGAQSTDGSGARLLSELQVVKS